jgi:pyroglutamyl-peptidase
VLLLTGFEPFGGLARNPSGDIARRLGDREGVRGAVLPVDYGRIRGGLEEWLGEPWDAVVLMGVAVGRPALSLERVAINFRDAERPDNAGYLPETPALVEGGPDAYFSTLPLERLKAALEEEQIPVAISLSAGPYLCNASMYFARHLLQERGTPCGFIHLPPTPDLACGATPMPLETQLRAIERVLRELASAY